MDPGAETQEMRWRIDKHRRLGRLRYVVRADEEHGPY
jgi:hypothetical protein